MNSFKSGCVHDQLAVTDQDTALATLQGMKESAAWAGLFDTSGIDSYTAPTDDHHWKIVPYGIKRIDEKGNPHWATEVIEVIGGKEFTRHLVKCTGCTACDEIGFRKVKTV